MKLTALLDQIDELELASGRAEGLEVSAVTFDSRKVGPGALFVALKGANVDGHDFVEMAVDKGAVAVLVDRDRAVGVGGCAVLVAQDTRQVLGALAEAFYDYPSCSLCVVGVTGTNGKTTTSSVLEALFKAAGESSGFIGTIGYRWGSHEEPAVNTTPESLVLQRLLARMRDDGVKRVAMEVSSHGLATHRLRGTQFDAAIFTNLTPDHLDFHEDMGAYRQAKARLFLESLPEARRAGKTPVAIINADDAVGRELAAEVIERGVDCVTFGLDRQADYRCEDLEQSLKGSRFLVVGGEDRFEVTSPLLGRFNVSNALAAAVAARRVGLAVPQIQAGFAKLAHVPGRMQRVEADVAGPSVFVDYAHTPDALERALETVRPLARGRLIVVFGCGGDRDRSKRASMGRAAVAGADLVVVTSDNPRTEEPEAIIAQILDGILEGNDAQQLGSASGASAALREARQGVWVETSRAEAIEKAVESAREDDVILIAGKGHETYQEIGTERVPFDDVKRAQQALSSRA